MSAADEIERVARLSHGRLVAILARRTGGLADAMDALADAVLRALEIWPVRGVRGNPEAWLVATARNRVLDAARSSPAPPGRPRPSSSWKRSAPQWRTPPRPTARST